MPAIRRFVDAIRRWRGQTRHTRRVSAETRSRPFGSDVRAHRDLSPRGLIVTNRSDAYFGPPPSPTVSSGRHGKWHVAHVPLQLGHPEQPLQVSAQEYIPSKLAGGTPPLATARCLIVTALSPSFRS